MTDDTNITDSGKFADKEKMKEKEIIKQIKEYLKTLPECFAWKEHGGMYGTEGLPDLIICFKGKFVAFEVKAEKGKLTVLQAAILRKIRQAGGRAEVVRSVDEARQIMESL